MLANYKEKCTNFKDKGLLRDVINCEMRAESISYASWKAKQLREHDLMLEKKLKGFEEIINGGDVTAFTGI